MQWGSQWAIATHSGVNPFCLCCCDDTLTNSGGASHSKTADTTSVAGTRSADGVNPLIRVMPPKADAGTALAGTLAPSSTISQRGTTERELIYATEAFDRRREAINTGADSRWQGVEYQQVRVPMLDTMLVVAFQKLLRDEEMEFLVLLLAMECE